MKLVNLCPFPHYDFEVNQIVNGEIFHASSQCHRNLNNKCHDYYQDIFTSTQIAGRFFQCPYGLGTYKFLCHNEMIVLSSLNIEKYSDRKSVLKLMSKSDFFPRLSINQFNRIITAFAESVSIIAKTNEISNNLEESNSYVTQNKELLDDTFHELRKLNNQLKSQVETLILKTDDNKEQFEPIKDDVRNVLSTSQLISIRLNTFDFVLNPELEMGQGKVPTPIYKKVEKAIHCLRSEAYKKNLHIIINGNSHNYVDGAPVLELLPYLVLDNAIKYCPKDETINVSFDETDEEIRIRIRNLGPRPKDDELSRLTERKFRSEFVAGTPGSGLGLYLVASICELNKVDLKIKLGDNRVYKNRICFSDFIVDLIFNVTVVKAYF